MRFGVCLPSYCYPDLNYERVQRSVGDFSRKANELGLDLWVIDHLLTAPGLYGMAWMEPLSVLTYAAALAPDVTLGTGILVAPNRHPVLLAKTVGTLDYLTGGRFILGLGPGWYPQEFEALGHRVQERGRRTDEVIEAMRVLLTQESASFTGRYYSFSDVTIEPRPATMPPIWVSGGSRIGDAEYSDVSTLAESVTERILRVDGWLARASGKQEYLKRDWNQVLEAMARRGRPRDSLVFAHENFIYLVETSNRDEALRHQERYFRQVMGDHRSFEHLRECYLMGTIDDVVERLAELESIGMEYVVLSPTSDELEQLDLIAKHLVPALGTA